MEKDNYIYNNGTLKFLDKDDKTIGDYECENKDENKCYVAYLTSENNTDLPVYLDEKESPLQRRSQIYNNKYVFVQDGDIINLYNSTRRVYSCCYVLLGYRNRESKIRNRMWFREETRKAI